MKRSLFLLISMGFCSLASMQQPPPATNERWNPIFEHTFVGYVPEVPPWRAYQCCQALIKHHFDNAKYPLDYRLFLTPVKPSDSPARCFFQRYIRRVITCAHERNSFIKGRNFVFSNPSEQAYIMSRTPSLPLSHQQWVAQWQEHYTTLQEEQHLPNLSSSIADILAQFESDQSEQTQDE